MDSKPSAQFSGDGCPGTAGESTTLSEALAAKTADASEAAASDAAETLQAAAAKKATTSRRPVARIAAGDDVQVEAAPPPLHLTHVGQ